MSSSKHSNKMNSEYNTMFDVLNKTSELLLEMPLYKKLKMRNDELNEKVKALRYTIEYLELLNKNLTKKNKKLKKLKNVRNDPNVKMEIVELNEDLDLELEAQAEE